MAKGSIRFDDLINVEVAVDPTQGEGAKLLSAVNLVDGQSLGGGGGDLFTLATETVQTHDAVSDTVSAELDDGVYYWVLPIGEVEYVDGKTPYVGPGSVTVGGIEKTFGAIAPDNDNNYPISHAIYFDILNDTLELVYEHNSDTGSMVMSASSVQTYYMNDDALAIFPLPEIQ